jgi:hypothetical protein
MWYAIIGIVAFFVGALLGFLSIGLFSWGTRQDEEHAASVRIADAREKLSKAKKNIKEFEEKYQASFSDFERSLAQSCSFAGSRTSSELAKEQRLFDYTDWAFWERTLAETQEEIKFQQIILRE